MTVRLEELLAAAEAWRVETDEPWRVRAEDDYPVAFCGTLPGTPDPNPTRAERHAALIALAPDAVRLLIDMGEELRKWSEWAERIQWVELDGGEVWDGGFASAATTALLARLDRLGNTT